MHEKDKANEAHLESSQTYMMEFSGENSYPVDTRTKNVRTKDVHKRTFIFGSIWKHGKTSQSERLMNVPMWYV